MTAYAPKGYSLNHYPQRYSSATHRVVAAGSVPVYKKYFEGTEAPSPSQHSNDLHGFLVDGTEVIVVDEHIGSNSAWSEIMIPGDTNAASYNLFIFNNKNRPVLTPLPLTKPSARYSENVNTRDYTRSIFSYDNRASNHVFHDALYEHYVVKISQTLNPSMSMEEMLQSAIEQGARKICSEYGVSLPEYTYEYLAERLFDFFNIFHYTLDIRGNSNINISSLVCYVTIKTKYLEPLFPNLAPTTEEIAAQDPQYRRAEGQGIRVNEHIDPWLDPARSPLDAENFMEQYIKNFKDQTGKDLDFKQAFEDMYARGTKKPWNLPSIIADEFSELPLIGSSWQDNQRNQADRARSQQAIAQQELERAVGKKIDDMFASLGLSAAKTREARESVRAFTSAVVSIGAGIEDINDMIDSVVDTLNNTPDIVNLQTGEVNVSPSQLISLIGAELDIGTAIAALPEANEMQATKTLEASFEYNQALANYFTENQIAILGDAALTSKYPLLWQVDESSLSKVFIHDNLFSFVERDGIIHRLESRIAEEVSKVTDPSHPSYLDLDYKIALLSIIDKLFNQDFDSFSESIQPGSPIEKYYTKQDLVEGKKQELVSLLEVDEERLKKIEERYAFIEPLRNEDGQTQREIIEEIIDMASMLEKTYTEDVDVLPFLSKEDSMKLYTVASKTLEQSIVKIPKIRIKTNNELEFLNEDSSPTSNKEFSGLKKGLNSFYSAVKLSLKKHEERDWKIKKLNSSKIDGIEKGVNKVIREVLKGLIKTNIPTLLKGTGEPKDILLQNVRLSLAYDKDYSLTFAHLSCIMPSGENYVTFAFTGASNEKYDIEKISPSVTYEEPVGQQLFLNNLASDYKNARQYAKDLPQASALSDPYSSAWRKIISNFFSRTEVKFIAPSERPEVIKRNAAYRTFYQNTKGRTEKQQRAVIKSIREFQDGVAPSDEETESNTDSIREGIADFAIPLTRAGEDAFSATFSSAEELSTELMSHIGLDTPALQPFIKCLFPEINLEKVLQDTEQYKLIKDMQDSILATAESAGAALDLYDTLEALFTPSEGSGGLKGMFLAVLDKVIDLLILEAFKAALEYIQTLCLRWQAFLMDMMTQALLGNAINESPIAGGNAGRQLPGTTGTTSSIGNGVIASLTLKGYTQDDIEILSSPEAIRYIEDLSNLLTPSEFCQLLTKDDAPEYLRDVAHTLYEELYKDTILSQLNDRAKLYSFLKVMGEFIDPTVCEALSRSSRLPERGYSHTSQICNDSDPLNDIKDKIVEGTAINPDELRQVLDNTAAKNAQDLKTMLVEIESQANGTSKIDLDPDKIFEDLPEVKKIRKQALMMTNSDLIAALTYDAHEYSEALTESGKEYFADEENDLVLGPMGYIYRRYAMGSVNEKLKSAYPSLRNGIYPETLSDTILRIIARNDDGSYKEELSELSQHIRQETGIHFSEKDIETIRIANPRPPFQPFRNLRSASSINDTSKAEYAHKSKSRQQLEYQRDRFLNNLKEELDRYSTEEKEQIIQMLKWREWKPKIGVRDIEGKRNSYFTDGDLAAVEAYYPTSNIDSDERYPISYSGNLLRPDFGVTADTLYSWLEEKTKEQTEKFFEKYKEEEGSGKNAIMTHAIFLGRPLGNDVVNVEPLLSYSEVSIIEEVGVGNSEIVVNYEIESDGDFSSSPEKDKLLKINKNFNLRKEAVENYSEDKYFIYSDSGKKYAAGIIKGLGAEKRLSVEITEVPTEEKNRAVIEKNIRDLVDQKGSTLFNQDQDVYFKEKERELLHYLIKQSKWDSIQIEDKTSYYGEKVFKILDNVRENFTELSKDGDYKNLLPELISEHLLGMLSIEKHLSEYSDLKEKFKSPVDFVDQPSSFERRDYSVEEKVDMWLSMKFFILTFVADYYLKMLPMVMSTDFFKDYQNELSKQIILNNIEVFLQEDRGPEFDIFRVKFFYYVNTFWLFLKQEKCSEIDITSFKNPMTAVSNIVEDAIAGVYSYLGENGLINSIEGEKKSSSKIISVRNYELDFSPIGDRHRDYDQHLTIKGLADSYGLQIHGYSFNPVGSTPPQALLNQFGIFKEKFFTEGMIVIAPEILEVKEYNDSGETSQRKISYEDFFQKTSPRDLSDARWETREYYKRYKIAASLKLILPDRTVTSADADWPKTELDPLETGVFKKKRVFDLETIESPEYFFDTKDPLNNGKDIYDNKATDSHDYLSATSKRLEESYKKINKAIRETNTYKLIDETINLLGTGEENNILDSLTYYSMYDYFDKLGHRVTFNNTRAVAINRFLKADARGTSYSDVSLSNPLGENSPEESSMEPTFYEYWAEKMDYEEWKETPHGAAETVGQEILENYPNASQEAIAEAKGEAYAEKKEEEAEQALANGDVDGYRAAKQEAGEVRAATTQGGAATAQGQSTGNESALTKDRTNTSDNTSVR